MQHGRKASIGIHRTTGEFHLYANSKPRCDPCLHLEIPAKRVDPIFRFHGTTYPPPTRLNTNNWSILVFLSLCVCGGGGRRNNANNWSTLNLDKWMERWMERIRKYLFSRGDNFRRKKFENRYSLHYSLSFSSDLTCWARKRKDGGKFESIGLIAA